MTMTTPLRKVLMIILCSLYSVLLHSQTNENTKKETTEVTNLSLEIETIDYYSNDIISSVTIKATSGGKVVASGITNQKGEFKMDLDFDKEYTINFSKSGFISKLITLNTKGVPEDKKYKCPNMLVQITLFEPNECIKAEKLDKPIGRAVYFPKRNVIDWDMIYSMPLLASVNDMLDDCAEKIAEQKRLEEQKEKEYASVIKNANKAYVKQDWDKAKEGYTKALTLFPDREDAKERLNSY